MERSLHLLQGATPSSTYKLILTSRKTIFRNDLNNKNVSISVIYPSSSQNDIKFGPLLFNTDQVLSDKLHKQT